VEEKRAKPERSRWTCGCLLRAAAQTPSLVCRPSSRALRLQVPLPSTARAPRSTTSVCPSCYALAALCCEHRLFPAVSRAPFTVRSPACTSRTKVTILLPFRHRAHVGQGAALAHVPVSTCMSSARKVKAFLLGFVPQRKLAHTAMLEDRRAADVLSHRRPSTLVAGEPYPRPASLSLGPT
jgi:hypothetical protein